MKRTLLWLTILVFVVLLIRKAIAVRYIDMQNKNVQAFLKIIRFAEGTYGPNGYRMLFGGGLFDSYNEHPNTVVHLGGYSSSAAGAYQILWKTWADLRKTYSDLTDFSPPMQDRAAVYLIRRRGALEAVKNGEFEKAIAKVNKEWASLPGSPYGQPTKTLAELQSVYTANGGAFTA